MRWLPIVVALAACRHEPPARDVAPITQIAIRDVPAAAATWRALFTVLPAQVEVEVDVARATDFARFMTDLREHDVPNRGRFHPRVTSLRMREPERPTIQLDAHVFAVSAQAALDPVADLLMARGNRIVRVPPAYTGALVDHERDGTRVMYLPTFGVPADGEARALFEREGFVVHPIDVAAMGELCVRVLARG